jgi:hypothetical protein
MKNLDLKAQLRRIFLDLLIVFWQCHGTEDIDLDFAAHIHADPVDNQDFWHLVSSSANQGSVLDITMKA